MTPIESLLREIEPEWPETPDPWPAVAAALAAPRPFRWLRVTSAAAAVAAAVVLGAVLFEALPVVADGLGVGAVDLKMATISEVADTLDLGEPVPGDAGVPVPAHLGAADAAFRDDGTGWLLYRPRPGLPEVLDSGVGALVARIEAEGFLEKSFDPTRTTITDVMVGGLPGLWLEGGPHEVVVVSADGVVVRRGRLAGNTLLWVDGDVTFRVELAASLETAFLIAESMEP